MEKSFLLGVGLKNDMFRINALTSSKVAQFISEHFGTNNIEIGQKLWLRRQFSAFFRDKKGKNHTKNNFLKIL